jgi:hypothetical protein
MALVSSLATSIFIPRPGPQRFTTVKPTINARVLTISKYSRARPPVRPTFFISSVPAMPSTTVVKMIGAMIILMSLMKASPRGFMAAPHAGSATPNATPAAIAIST